MHLHTAMYSWQTSQGCGKGDLGGGTRLASALVPLRFMPQVWTVFPLRHFNTQFSLRPQARPVTAPAKTEASDSASCRSLNSLSWTSSIQSIKRPKSACATCNHSNLPTTCRLVYDVQVNPEMVCSHSAGVKAIRSTHKAPASTKAPLQSIHQQKEEASKVS